MKPEQGSHYLLGITRSKAKMFEYAVPLREHLRIPKKADPSNLFALAVGILGDQAVPGVSGGNEESELDGEDAGSLGFSTRFFDSYLEARFDSELNRYLLLVGAAAYYLNDRPGSAQVLTRRLEGDIGSLESRGLEYLLHWLLQDDRSVPMAKFNGRYGQAIGETSNGVSAFFNTGEGVEIARSGAVSVIDTAYRSGSPREVLFADLIGAIVTRRIKNSSWECLPRFSNIEKTQWRGVIQKQGFTKELWPAQILLGRHGVFAGKSAVVQFPTSAGKTHAVEMILRSAFLSKRARVAVVVAPFRALCHEVGNRLVQAFSGEDIDVNEVSDVLQLDLADEIAKLLGAEVSNNKVILVLTPEKLLYTLRQSPELAKHIGLLVLDEGHQFDNGSRGVTYELLISALKELLPLSVQKLLVSAVIPNADQIAKWLMGEDGAAISGSNLLPTERSIAFSSWKTARGQLQFVDPADSDREEFFVPRVLEQQWLNQTNDDEREVFPKRESGNEIALYLGLKVSAKGGVAIFCGRKDTAASISTKLVAAYGRGLKLPKPRAVSDDAEVEKLTFLHSCHFGETATHTRCAGWGVFLHHGNTPNGIRLAVEHAMKEGMARFVICTSTLAQGVNLPIRYMVMTSVYQAGQEIKVRDFHNLIGRTGRSGMHTEGTILFSDPKIYDTRKMSYEKWRWGATRRLLRAENLEPCSSALLSILEPLRSDDNTSDLDLSILDFVTAYVDDEKALLARMVKLASEEKETWGKKLLSQVEWKIGLLAAIESYLMAHREEGEGKSFAEDSRKLVGQTLAYFLAGTDQRTALEEIFLRLANHIEARVPSVENQKRFGKTMFGVYSAMKVEAWTRENLDGILACESEEKLLEVIWPYLELSIPHNLFRKCDLPSALRELAFGWIAGNSYRHLFEEFTGSGARRIWGKQKRAFKLDDVVDICENAFGYDSTLIINGIAEISGDLKPEDSLFEEGLFASLQKRMRYGLPDRISIMIHEAGFADRVVALEVREEVPDVNISRRQLLLQLREQGASVLQRLGKYPSYFSYTYRTLFGLT